MSDQWHGGKGSKYRKVDAQKFADNWDAIFGKNKDINTTTTDEVVDNGDKEEAETERETDP